MAEAQPFRVTIRQDDTWVRMHLAKTDTMVDALPVVIINRKIAEMDPGVYHAIVALASAIGAAVCRNILGEEPIRIDVMEPPEEEEKKHG
jgi:hypothetical protein